MTLAKEKAWVRLRRIEMRELAHQIGAHALRLNRSWPHSGEGRALKATCERIIRRLEVAHVGNLPEMVKEFNYLDSEFDRISENTFFASSIGVIIPKEGRFKGKSFQGCIQEFRDIIGNFVTEKSSVVDARIPLSPVTFARLENLIPEQKFGPAKFFIQDGRLKLLNIQEHSSNPNRPNVQMAREEIANIASVVEDEVKLTNASPRLVSYIAEMRMRLASRQNVMQLGIASMAFDLVCDAASDELDVFISARLKGLSLAIKSYVGQFKEWEQYCETAALSNMSESDPQNVLIISTDLAEKLGGVPKELVDPEIPKTLRMINEAIGDPAKSYKRAVWAAIRTVENIISVIFRSALDLAGSGFVGVKTGARYALTMVTFTLALSALSRVSNLSPYLTKSLDAEWVKKAADLLPKE